MNDKKEDDSFSTAKTNSSSLNKDNHSSKKEEDDFIHKAKTRGGIKHKINFFSTRKGNYKCSYFKFSWNKP